MKRIHLGSCLCAALAVGLLPAGILRAAPRRFDSEAHFPKESYGYFAVDFGALRKGFAESPLGRIAGHPGVRKALGSLPAVIRKEWVRSEAREFTEELGADPFELLDLLEGKVAFSLSTVDPRRGPAMLLSVDLGTRRSRILKVMDSLGGTFLREMRGGERVASRVKGHAVTTWPARYGPNMKHLVLGNHLVVVMNVSDDVIVEALIDRFEGRGKEGDSLEFNKNYARANLLATGAPSAVTAFVNWEGIRKVAEDLSGSDPEMVRVFGALGLDKLSSAVLRAGFRDGALESKLALDSPGGFSGVLGALACVGAPGEAIQLSRVPAGALEIAACSLAKGKLLRIVMQKIKEGFPFLAPAIDGLAAEYERRTGVSFERDVFRLPALGITAFTILPPAGGFVPDAFAIVRAGEFEPYLVLLDRMARKIGAEITSIDAGGRPVAVVSVGNYYAKIGWTEFLGLKGGPDVSFSLAFTAIDDEWMLVASSAQAVRRYFSHYVKMPSAADDATVRDILKKRVGGKGAFALLHGGRSVAPAWNTAVSLGVLATPAFERHLRPFGVNLAHLPPAEEFGKLVPGGFVTFHVRKDSAVLHGRAALANIAASPTVLAQLAAIAIAAAAAGDATGSRASALAAARLRTLGKLMMVYAETSGTGAFPFDPAGSLASIQKLAGSGLLKDPLVLVHPLGQEVPAAPDADGKLVLESRNVSYEVVGWKQGLSDNPSRILAYEKRAYDGRGRHVLFVDLSVRFLVEDEFQGLLARQTAKYGRKKKGTAR